MISFSTFLKKLFSFFVLIFLLIPGVPTRAEENSKNLLLNQNNNEGTILLYPYQKTFTISAYYSPIPNQNKYVTGSYEGDIRLNGRGVRGADGSPVYPGMIAAPKSYAFGTKMKIPGVGVVAVHDRGGAIVHAGERSQVYDRLDVWMGYGDIGLKRALQWGKRNVEVTVYGINDSIKEEVYLEGYSEAEKYAQASFEDDSSMFHDDLSNEDQGNEVQKLQESLQKLGFYNGELSQTFDEKTRQALIQFQIRVGLIDDEKDFGAGFFGPQTRRLLQMELKKMESGSQSEFPLRNLQKDDRGEDVKKLQQALQKLNYDVEITGIYDAKTVEAIFQFQKDHQILNSKDDVGAGVLGPKTLSILVKKINGETIQITPKNDPPKSPLFAQNSFQLSNVKLFERDLKLGDSGEDVRKLQQELKNIHFLGIEPTGFYGDVTAHALFKFQQKMGMVKDKNHEKAGIFAGETRKYFNNLLTKRQETHRLMAEKKALAPITVALE